MNSYVTTFKRYTVFHGRAGRPEFWRFTLTNAAVFLGTLLVDLVPRRAWGAIAIGLVGDVFLLVVALPWLGVTIRRLHDTNRSGWWVLLELVPFGLIVLLWWLAQPSDTGDSQYGSEPNLVGGDR